MCIREIVFSPTGGTKQVADILSQALGGQCNREPEGIDLTDPQLVLSEIPLEAEAIAVIAAPCYDGRIPALCAERILSLRGNGARAVLVCVYGNRAYEDALAELSDLAERAGFSVEAAVAAVAEHSIVREIAAGRPDAEDSRELSAFAAKIGEKLRAGPGSPSAKPTLPGNAPHKEFPRIGLVPTPDGTCTGCGLCAEKCPALAIDRENPRLVNTEKCISCMRCVALCPISARRIPPATSLAIRGALQKLCPTRKKNELFL